MGVSGLWQLLEPTARPVELSHGADKVLAVDISIWLQQIIKGMKTKGGETIQGAHIIGVFSRVLRLLFHNVKPVFVFDGGVPELKESTLRARRTRRAEGAEAHQKVKRRILHNQLKRYALGEKNAVLDKPKPKKPDLFQLPDDVAAIIGSENSSDDEDSQDGQVPTFMSLNNVDINSEDFANLPLEVQHEMLVDLQETEKHKTRRGVSVTRNPDDEKFSEDQIAGVIKKNLLTKKLEHVRVMLSKQTTGEDGVSAHKIVSEDNTLYILQKEVDMNETEGNDASDFEDNGVDDSADSMIGDDENDENDKPGLLAGEIALNLLHKRRSLQNEGVNDVDPSSSPSFASDDNKESQQSMENSIESDEIELVAKANEDVEDTIMNTKQPEDAIVITRENELNQESSESSDESENEAMSAQQPHKINSMSSRDVSTATIEDKSQGAAKVPMSEGLPANTPADSSVVIKSIVDDTIIDTQNSVEKTITTMQNSSSGVSVEKTDQVVKSSNSLDSVVVVTDGEDEEEVSNVSMERTQGSNRLNSVAVVTDDEDEEELVSVHGSPTKLNNVQTGPAKSPVSIAQQIQTLQHEEEELLPEARRAAAAAETVSQEMLNEVQDLLRLLGLPFIIAPMEAEAQCAKLEELGLTNGTITDDSDIFLFGGKTVYRRAFSKKGTEFYQAKDVHALLGLDRDKLIQLAFFLGCDYTPGIQGVGIVTAMEILAEFPGNTLQEFRTWFLDDSDATVDIEHKKLAKKLKLSKKPTVLPPGFPDSRVTTAFITPVVDPDTTKFKWGLVDLDGIRKYMSTKLAWSQEQTDGQLLPVIRRQTERRSKQPAITAFMTGPSLFGNATLKLKPRISTAAKKLQQQQSDSRSAISKQDGEGSSSKKRKLNPTDTP
eukprot:m.20936 g.20936  ORF g.20936 m.20936 type:complete len:888 (-) comp7000_c0_seq1:854-3517(-)